MAKKNQQQASGNRHQALGEPGQETPGKLVSGAAQDGTVSVAEEVAEVQGSEAAAPLARIGPDDAAPAEPAVLPVVDPLDAAAARRKNAREDAVHELRSFARRSADGDTLTDAENDRIIELCDLARWTPGIFKTEITIAANRIATRRKVNELPKAREALEKARARHAEAKADLELAMRELQKDINLWAGRIAEAEAFITVAEDAEKELLRSAPTPIRDGLRRAQAAGDTIRATLSEAERRLNHAITTVNSHKAARTNVGDGTEEGARLDALIMGAAEAVKTAQDELHTVRERKAEIEAEVAELQHLAQIA